MAIIIVIDFIQEGLRCLDEIFHYGRSKTKPSKTFIWPGWKEFHKFRPSSFDRRAHIDHADNIDYLALAEEGASLHFLEPQTLVVESSVDSLKADFATAYSREYTGEMCMRVARDASVVGGKPHGVRLFARLGRQIDSALRVGNDGRAEWDKTRKNDVLMHTWMTGV